MTPKQLKDKRKRYGITQRVLAAMLDVTVTTVARWEQGSVNIPEKRIPDIEWAVQRYDRKQGAA